MRSYRKMPRSAGLRAQARLLSIAGDETRIRILCFLFEYGGACVSDIAESVGVSVNTASHHLRLMKGNGMLESERTGTRICYTLIPSALSLALKRVVCG